MLRARVRMGKYLYYWMLQGLFYISVLGMAFVFEDAEEYYTAFVVGLPIFAAVSLILMVFLYYRAWVVDGRRHWVYFAVFIFIAAIIAGVVWGFINDDGYGFIDSFMMLAGVVGFVGTLVLQAFGYAFKPKKNE